MNNIGLYGIEGVYNFGCEAIVRGTVEILKKIGVKEEQITYFSADALEDKKYLKDLKIQVIQLDRQQNYIVRIINKVFRIAKVPYQLKVDDLKKIEKTDVIFSIGGDMYTIPKWRRQKKVYSYYNRLVQSGNYFIKRGKKIVIFGASIGPFGNRKKAIAYYIDYFKRVNLIVAREDKCLNYLEDNGVSNNTLFFPDPAFFVKLENTVQMEKKYIGINLSPLSLIEIYGSVSKEMIDKLCVLMRKIIKETNLDILLIPHVLSPNVKDNDLLFLEKIKMAMDSEVSKKIKIGNNKNFLETKQLLHQCKMVIAARMHCAVNAVSENIPTIFLAYSHKAEGMCKYVYGDKQWSVTLNQIDNELIEKVRKMYEEKDEISNYLKKRMLEIRNLENYKEEIRRMEAVIKE